jgi:hypothetical protein
MGREAVSGKNAPPHLEDTLLIYGHPVCGRCAVAYSTIDFFF